jgi:2-polyprenyl-6-methoxyphenol hydroxylase-like FAD-dependent oxidoreductase
MAMPTAERTTTTPIGAHAVVIGAGIGGLFAARVLSEFYEHVTVIDRDTLPRDSDSRSGVPQGRHLHALLTAGALVIREFFPGLIEDLIADGAPTGDILARGRVYFDGHRMAQAPSGLPGLGATRPELEHRIRLRLADLANVRVVAPCRAVGLTASRDGHTVTGVRVASSTAADDQDVLAADLVVDASGRGSILPRWLADIGYPQPEEDRIGIDVAYASCAVALPNEALDGDLGVAVGATVDIPRGGGLVRTANERWLVSLAGYHGHHPPVTPDGLLAFARTLVAPDLYEALRHATLLSSPVRYRIPYAVRRRYERLDRFPDGLVVLGDAVSSFNPLYGQGMSVAAKEALILQRCLQQGPHSLRRFRYKIGRTGTVAWLMSVSSDLRMPWIEGRRTPLVRFGNAYAARLFRAAERDPAVARAFMRVANLVDPVACVVRPTIAVRVLAGGLGGQQKRPRMLSGHQDSALRHEDRRTGGRGLNY